MSNRVAFGPVMCVLLASCGSSSMEGVYSGENTGFLDKIELKSDHKAELTFMGMTKEGTYEVDEGRVKITQAGETTILRIDDAGCLDGGGIIGTYCKGEAKPEQTKAEQTKAEPKKAATVSDSLIGGRFSAGPKGDQMTVEFLDASTVRMTISGDSEKLKYSTSGDKIVIQGVEGRSLSLAKRGVDLEGGPDGMVVVFKRGK